MTKNPLQQKKTHFKISKNNFNQSKLMIKKIMKTIKMLQIHIVKKKLKTIQIEFKFQMQFKKKNHWKESPSILIVSKNLIIQIKKVSKIIVIIMQILNKMLNIWIV